MKVQRLQLKLLEPLQKYQGYFTGCLPYLCDSAAFVSYDEPGRIAPVGLFLITVLLWGTVVHWY